MMGLRHASIRSCAVACHDVSHMSASGSRVHGAQEQSRYRCTWCPANRSAVSGRCLACRGLQCWLCTGAALDQESAAGAASRQQSLPAQTAQHQGRAPGPSPVQQDKHSVGSCVQLSSLCAGAIGVTTLVWHCAGSYPWFLLCSHCSGCKHSVAAELDTVTAPDSSLPA